MDTKIRQATGAEAIAWRLRTGELTVGQVETAARLGHPDARELYEGSIDWSHWIERRTAISYVDPGLYAADCVERVLYAWDRVFPGDRTIWDIIEVIRTGSGTCKVIHPEHIQYYYMAQTVLEAAQHAYRASGALRRESYATTALSFILHMWPDEAEWQKQHLAELILYDLSRV